MLIASFADLTRAEAFAARHSVGLIRIAPGLLLWRDTALWPDVPRPLIGLQGAIVDRRAARLLPPAAVAVAVEKQGDEAFGDWAPAFRLAWRNGNTLSAAADHAGLGHWYIWTASGAAAVADSATAIARLFGLAADSSALGGLALTGAMVGLDSAIVGVKKLPAGQIAGLADGRLTLRAMPAASRLVAPEQAVTSAVTRLHAAHPAVEMELSGGWDSRLVLAALPAADRQTTTGFTMGNPGDPDVVVASLLAANAGMHHEVMDQGSLGRLCASELTAVLANAAERDDFAGNPLDRAGLNLINAVRPSQPRFSGQNGEILRGFYYPGQPLDAAPSARLAARVIDWRIISNDLVAPTLFDPTWLNATRAAMTARLTDLLLSSDACWGDALDRFYLEQRMHRWYGTAASATLGRRPVLLPFFDEDVLALARETPATAKASSRFFAREMYRLDPALASIPLDSGIIPSEVARDGLAYRLARARIFATKAILKVRQQVTARDRATMGSATAGALAIRHQLYKGVDLHRLTALGIFSPAALDAFARGEGNMGRATLGFVLNVDRLLTTLANRGSA